MSAIVVWLRSLFKRTRPRPECKHRRGFRVRHAVKGMWVYTCTGCGARWVDK